jgi:hypothetical protein
MIRHEGSRYRWTSCYRDLVQEVAELIALQVEADPAFNRELKALMSRVAAERHQVAIRRLDQPPTSHDQPNVADDRCS